MTYPNRGHRRDIVEKHLNHDAPQPTTGIIDIRYDDIKHVPAPPTSEDGSDGRMDEWTDGGHGWIDGWMDGWMDGWTNGRTGGMDG